MAFHLCSRVESLLRKPAGRLIHIEGAGAFCFHSLLMLLASGLAAELCTPCHLPRRIFSVRHAGLPPLRWRTLRYPDQVLHGAYHLKSK